eukprot:781368-Amphidinium_carterae.5
MLDTTCGGYLHEAGVRRQLYSTSGRGHTLAITNSHIGLKERDGDAHRPRLVTIDNNELHESVQDVPGKLVCDESNENKGKGTTKAWSKTQEHRSPYSAANHELKIVLPRTTWPAFWDPIDGTQRIVQERRRTEGGWTW